MYQTDVIAMSWLGIVSDMFKMYQVMWPQCPKPEIDQDILNIPAKSYQQVLEWFILNVPCNVPSHVTITYQIGTFWVHLQCTNPVWLALSWLVHLKCTCNIFTMYQTWEIKNTWQVYCEYIEESWDIVNVFRKYWIFAICSQCKIGRAHVWTPVTS